MGARGRVRALIAVALLAMLGAALPAGASGRTAGINVNGTAPAPILQLTGSLTYEWHGDRARGCAASGLCAVSGSVTVSGNGNPVFLNSFASVRELPLESATLTARVARVSRTSTFTCVDSLGNGLGGGTLALELMSARVARGAAAVTGGPSAGRCAGPLASELDAVRIPYRSSSRGGVHIDLRARRSFTAGPFSGELISTLRVVPWRGFGTSGTSGSQGSSPGPPPHRQRFETLDLTYRVGVRGSLVNAYTGVAEPDCEPFDACGASGSQTVAISSATELVDLVGQRPVRGRRTTAQIFGDLRAGRLGLQTPVPVELGATTLERLSWPDGTACTDRRTGGGLFALLGAGAESGWTAFGGSFGGGFYGPAATAAGAATFPLLVGQSGDTDAPLRTHCPGPGDADLSDANGALVKGGLPLAELGAKAISVTMSSTGRFAMPGYTGTRSGALTMVLTLVRFHAGTRVVSGG